MSAIGAIAGGLSQFIQNLNPSGAASSTSNASSGTLTGHHHHHGGGGGLGKLADAITSALQGAANGSAGSTTTDANQTITQALTKIFQNSSLTFGNDTDSDTDSSQASTDATGTDSSASSNGLPAAFVQTLQSFGVTPQQFQTDLKTAMQNATQNGTFDPSSVLKNFPMGSILDELG
jgi:hypothetical protein